MCDWKEGAAHWVGDVVVEICVWNRAFRGSVGADPRKGGRKRPVWRLKLDLKRGIYGMGGGRHLGGGVNSKKLED